MARQVLYAQLTIHSDISDTVLVLLLGRESKWREALFAGQDWN